MTDQTSRDTDQIELRLDRPYLGVAVTISIAFILVLTMAVVVQAAREGFLPFVLGGILLVFVLCAGLVTIWNRRVVIDSDRIGVSNGIFRPRNWVRFSDVVHVAYRQQGNPAARPQFGVLLYATSGGSGPVGSVLLRIGISSEDRERVAALTDEHGGLGRLLIPASEFKDPQVPVLSDALASRLPELFSSSAASIIDQGWSR